MSSVQLELAEGAVSVDASLIARDLALAPQEVLERLRGGRLTARCEQGIGEDAGRFRLTFYHESTRLRLIVDQEGRILKRSVDRLRGHRNRRS